MPVRKFISKELKFFGYKRQIHSENKKPYIRDYVCKFTDWERPTSCYVSRWEQNIIPTIIA